ncbi:MDR family MFS transporter [Streptomyces sp. HNM0645]|uniref:MDR family MFS transporter n=1 Tax=Streptomyces sp. HNM0645 TaxID=2782343 RepID=UPI0024B76CD4|nr:MDR family MFS transporter [Streptomyces sp. HNM0645]MDI9884658.1 MDR family MFS transporter [Streptomyces sp. HNM0645]
MGVLQLGMLVAAFDQTALGVALPNLVADLGGVHDLVWVVGVNLLAATVSAPLWGKFGDMYGRRRALQADLLILLVGCVLAGAAQSMTQLIVFRVVQGLGSGGLVVLSLAVVSDLVPPEDRGRRQGSLNAMFAIGTGLAPLAGGLLAQYASWRWIFYGTAVLSALAFIGSSVALRVPEPHGVRRGFDYIGLGLLAALSTCLLLSVSLGGPSWKAWQVIAYLVLAVMLGGLFLARERRAPHPLMPPRLFGSTVFALLAAVAFLMGAAKAATSVYLPLFLQIAMGSSPFGTGLIMVSLVVGITAGSLASGELVSRTGRYKPCLIAGTGLTSVGLVLTHLLDARSSSWTVVGSLAVFGVGFGLTAPILTLAVQNAVGYEDLGVSVSGIGYFRSLGRTLGVAVVGTVFAVRLGHNLAEEEAMRDLDIAALRAVPTLLDAYTLSIRETYLGSVGLALIAFALSWFLREIPLQPGATPPETADPLRTAPVPRTSIEEVERILSAAGNRQVLRSLFTRIAETADVRLPPQACWLLITALRESPLDLRRLKQHSVVDASIIGNAVEALEAHGLARASGTTLVLTGEGREVAAHLTASRRRILHDVVGTWATEEHATVEALLERLDKALTGQDDLPPG